MNKSIDWKDRAEKAEAKNIKVTRQWSVEVSELRAELERVQKQAADMRNVLELLNRLGGLGFEKHAWIKDALSNDAGRNYFHRREFKPLVEACLPLESRAPAPNFPEEWRTSSSYMTRVPYRDLIELSEAMIGARKKGLIE